MTAPRILSADEILSCSDLVDEVVDVPEWGGAVKVRSFSKAVQQDVVKVSQVAGELDNDRFAMEMFIHGVIEPRFTEDQYELLRAKASSAINRVINVIMRLSGLNEEAVDTAKEKFPA